MSSFQINDIILDISPEQIQVSRNSFPHVWQTLRTRSSIIVKSGYSDLTIHLNGIKFTDTQTPELRFDNQVTSGYSKLVDLVAQLRLTPFCYVQNEFLRNSILGGDNRQTMVLALKEMQIVKDSGADTNVITVDFVFAWFNYFPYSSDFKYKKDIFEPRSVNDPIESSAWRRFYLAERERGKYASVNKVWSLGSGAPAPTTASFKQFLMMPIQKLQGEQKNQLQKFFTELDNLRAIRDTISNQKHKIREDRQEALALIRTKLSARIGTDPSVGTMLDENISSATTMMGKPEASGSSFYEELLKLLSLEKLQKKADEILFNVEGEEWSPVLMKDGNTVKIKADPLAKAVTDFSDGNTSILLHRKQTLEFEESNIVITGMSINFENVLATMPVIGHPYPTFQHIGSVDAVVTISMMTTSRDSVKSLSRFYSIMEDQAMKFRHIPQGQRNVVINNELINAIGLRDFVTDSLKIVTVPGQPGTYSATLSLINNSLDASTQEKILPGQQFLSSDAVRMEITRVLEENLSLIPEALKMTEESLFSFLPSLFNVSPPHLEARALKEDEFKSERPAGVRGRSMAGQGILISAAESGYYKYKGPTASGFRDFSFKDLCTEYGRKLGEVWIMMVNLLMSTTDRMRALSQLEKDIEETRLNAGDMPNNKLTATLLAAEKNKDAYMGEIEIRINVFYSLTNKDLFGVERLQEDLLPVAREVINSTHKKNNAYFKNYKFSDLSSLRKLAVEGVSTTTYNDANDVNAHLQLVEDFKLKYLAGWNKWSTDFLDRIKLGHLSLPQFETAYDIAMSNLSMSHSSNAYPDFPFPELLSQLEGTSAEAQLNSITKRLQLHNRNITADSLFGPDFYLYSSQDSVERILGSDAILKAKDSVMKAQDERHDVEKTWIEEVYNPRIIGSVAANEVNTQLQRESDYDKSFYEHVKEDILGIMRKMTTGEAPVWHIDDFDTDKNNAITCSLDSQRALKPIIPLAIDGTTDKYQVSTNRRGSETMSPPEHYAAAQHRFGTDVIDFIGAEGYAPPDPPDPSKTPVFAWPVEGGKTETFINSTYLKVRAGISDRAHPGIDIVSKKGNEDSVKKEVRSVAAGEIINIVPLKPWKGEWIFTKKRKGVITKQHKKKESTVQVKIKHGQTGWVTIYMHMQWDDFMEDLYEKWDAGGRSPIPVEQGEKIGMVGDTGHSTGPHLHFETYYKQRKLDPKEVLNGDFRKHQGPLIDWDPINESLFTRSCEQFESSLIKGQGYSMARAYPTFRLYFIESDRKERRRFAFDDFFSYSSVKEIQVIRSRKIAADLCILYLTNISGVLSNRKFRNEANEKYGDTSNLKRDESGKIVEEDKNNPRAVNTIDENPVASMMLQAGTEIQLRLGYSSNPDDLDKVFNGVITDVTFSENDDLVEIVCQSFAVELVQSVHGEAKEYGGFFSNAGRTGAILEEMMAMPEMVHFGRWQKGSSAKQQFRSVLTDRWGFKPSPQDDNIFAPAGRGIHGIFDSTEKYILYESTIWDVFQEMCLRHPSYVALPVPYEEEGSSRMTMFFGSPEQPYFSRDPTLKEINDKEAIKAIVEEAKDIVEHSRSEINTITESDTKAKNEKMTVSSVIQDEKDRQAVISARDFWLRKTLKQFALDKHIVKPFRGYHLLSSTMNILRNGITSSVDGTFNTATVCYGSDVGTIDETTKTLQMDGKKNFTLKCDKGLPEEDVRELYGEFPNCIGYEMAKRYGVGLLFQSLKEGYRGTITTMGMPAIKPYDICYIFDEYTDMFGPIEVEQVVHRFSQQGGFVTEITPDMMVHVNQLATMCTTDAMGLMAESAMRKLGIPSLPSIVEKCGDTVKTVIDVAVASNPLALIGSATNMAFTPIANMFFNSGEHSVGDSGHSTNPLAMIGAFIFRKQVTRSQLAHPFRYSPLVKSGKPMLGGTPCRLTDGGFLQGLDKWAKAADDGIELLVEDIWDNIRPNNWFGSWGAHSQGKFFKK